MGKSVGNQASDLVVNAMGYLGVPYKRGGNSSAGFDCSGFVRAMYENTLGLVLPHNAKAQAAATEKIDRSELQPGDLVFYNTLRTAFSHVASMNWNRPVAEDVLARALTTKLDSLSAMAMSRRGSTPARYEARRMVSTS